MNDSVIREWEEEVNRFAVEADHLHQFLTAELGKYWDGPAFEACQRESNDNRELALEAIQICRDLIGECGHFENNNLSLSSDILL